MIYPTGSEIGSLPLLSLPGGGCSLKLGEEKVVWKEKVRENCPCLLRFLIMSSGCWRSLGAWRSALMSTRLTPWPPFRKNNPGKPYVRLCISGYETSDAAASPLVNHVDVPSMPRPANLSVPEKNQWSREVTPPVSATGTQASSSSALTPVLPR